MLTIRIQFRRWPSAITSQLNTERLKDALIHVLRLVGLIDAEISVEIEEGK